MHHQAKIKVRYTDCDFLGHVNNSVFSDYMIDAVAELLSIDLVDKLRITSISIDFQNPIRYGEDATIDIWILPEGENFYQIRNASGDIAVQARMTWTLSNELDTFLSDKIKAMEVPFKLKPFKVKHLESQGNAFHWDINVQNRDQTKGRIISPSSIILWGSEATLVSSSKNGWDFEHMMEANCAVYVLRHELDILEHPSWVWRDSIKVTSYLHDLKTVRGTWRHEFVSTKTNHLIARLYITGVFVNIDGQVISPPEGLTDACLLGENR